MTYQDVALIIVAVMFGAFGLWSVLDMIGVALRAPNRKRCPHDNLEGIYGDQINRCGGYRLRCLDCGRLIDGPVSLAKDRGWARRDNTDTGLIRPYLTEARDQMRGTSDDAKTRQAVELLLAAWQPVDGTPLRWSLEWLARNTDRTHT